MHRTPADSRLLSGQARNDLYAGEIKFVKDELSVMARLELAVPDGQGEDLLKAADGDAWECGPFVVRARAGKPVLHPSDVQLCATRCQRGNAVRSLHVCRHHAAGDD